MSECTILIDEFTSGNHTILITHLPIMSDATVSSITPPPETLESPTILGPNSSSIFESDNEHVENPNAVYLSDVSSDTSGTGPEAGEDDDEDDQTVCQWEDCGQDLESLERLVSHIHDGWWLLTMFVAVYLTCVIQIISDRGNQNTPASGLDVHASPLFRLLDSLSSHTYVPTLARNLSVAHCQSVTNHSQDQMRLPSTCGQHMNSN